MHIYWIMGALTVCLYYGAESAHRDTGKPMTELEKRELWDSLVSGIHYKVANVLSYVFMFALWPLALAFLVSVFVHRKNNP